MDSGFQLLDSKSFSEELGFRIPIVSGIPDSYSCIPDSKAKDSEFYMQKFPGSRNPDSLTWGERRNMDRYYLFTFVEVLSIVWLKKARARITLNGADHNISFSFQTLITFSANFLNFQ